MHQKVDFLPDLDVLQQEGSLMMSSARVSSSIAKSVSSSLARSTNILSAHQVPGVVLRPERVASPLLALAV